MPDITDFTPVVQETIETIRARLDADVNAGLDPADLRWVDTVEGGVYWDLTQVVALEMERLWDALGTEIPAAMFPSFAWGDFLDDHATTYGLTRKDAIAATGTIQFTGTVGTQIATGTQVSTTPSDPDDDPITYSTTVSGTIPGGGTILLLAQADDTGTEGNVAIGIVNQLSSPIAGIASVSNVTPMASGEDVESDTDLQTRVLVEIESTVGAGTSSDYVRWSLAYPGVGNATVQPLWSGPGTVRVVVTDTDNEPVSGGIVTGLQNELDPPGNAGQGQGLAPIGAIVTVSTPTFYYANAQATIVHQAGYSLDGAGGTIATRASIVAAVTAYVNTLVPGAAVILNRIVYEALTVPGVLDVTSPQLAGFTTLANAQAGTPTDRAMSAVNLPISSGSVARLVQTILT